MNILLYTAITLMTILTMEFVAWFAHKYVMHGLLWIWHEDHHKPHHEKDGFFEKNDLFFFKRLYLRDPLTDLARNTPENDPTDPYVSFL